MEDLQIVEHVCRKDPKVIEQCVLSGIPAEDMHKVYCDRELNDRPHDNTSDFPSLDNWIRPQIWQRCSITASSYVLPTTC
jgi:Cu2+-containing amine oxidase